jgi:hypothetical protein
MPGLFGDDPGDFGVGAKPVLQADPMATAMQAAGPGGILGQAKPTPYDMAKQAKLAIEAHVSELGGVLKQFPRSGPMNMLSDEIKMSPEYKEAKGAYDAAFGQLRSFNEYFLKQFKNEVKAERDATRSGTPGRP